MVSSSANSNLASGSSPGLRNLICQPVEVAIAIHSIKCSLIIGCSTSPTTTLADEPSTVVIGTCFSVATLSSVLAASSVISSSQQTIDTPESLTLTAILPQIAHR